MALSVDEIKNRYPLPAFNFKVIVHQSSKTNSGETKPIPTRFSEITGLEHRQNPIIYRDGFSFLTGFKLMDGNMQPVRLSCKRGVVSNDNFMFGWIKIIGLPMPHRLLLKRDIHIELTDEEGNAKVRWEVRGALPVALTAPDFKADDPEVAIECLELIAEDMQVAFL